MSRDDLQRERNVQAQRAPALALLCLAATLAVGGALGLSSGLAQASPTHPKANAITIASQTQTPHYPSTITFQLRASDTAGAINSAQLAINLSPEGLDQTIMVHVDTPGSLVSLSYTYDTSSDYLPPFTPITYHWILNDGNAQDTLIGANQQFDFEDTRFTWSHLTQNQITVYWYNQDATFGQSLLKTAVSEAMTIEGDLKGQITIPLRVISYASNQDLHGGLPPNTPNWAGGVALIELHQCLIVVGGAGNYALQRDLPHELTHLIFHEVAGLNCGGCPLWFDEGMAVYHQLYHEPEMQFRFDSGVKSNTLLNFSTLAARFPDDSDLAELAYAQSWNFIKYLYQQYGEPKVAQLVNALTTTNFFPAFTAAFGTDMDQLESQWHVSLGLPPTVAAPPTSTPVTTTGSSGGGQTPVTPPANSSGNGQLTILALVVFALLVAGLLGGGYLWWRDQRAPAPVAEGAAPPSYDPYPPRPGMPPPTGFPPGYSQGAPPTLAGPLPGPTMPDAPVVSFANQQQLEHRQQLRYAITDLLAQEKRLVAQQAQLQAQLAQSEAQERQALAANRPDLAAAAYQERQQLESGLRVFWERLNRLRTEKQQAIRLEQEVSAALEAASRQSQLNQESGLYTGGGWAQAGANPAAPRRSAAQE